MAFFQHELFGDHFLLITLKILIALVLSGLIGFEREMKRHSAGFRTHILVGIGSCLMMILSLYGFENYIAAHDNIRFDPARIPSYVISGIGFLGAGTIIFYGGTIRGLTTAASIWTVAGLGLIVGAGMYAVAVFTTIVILLSLIFLNNIEEIFVNRNGLSQIEIILLPEAKVHHIIQFFEKHHVPIQKMELTQSENNLKRMYIKLEEKKDLEQLGLFTEIAENEQVKHISIIK